LHVEQDHVRGDVRQACRRLLAACRFFDRVSLPLKHHAHGPADVLLVVDDQDGCGNGLA
jgi:hypothetical protein